MKIRTKRLPVAGLILLSLSLAACGSGGEAQAPAEGTTAAGEATAPPATAEAAPPVEAAAPAAAPAPAEQTATKAEAKTAVKASKDVPVRGKNGLEEKCLARVGKETGTTVIGTNRIDESEAATDIYVNIEGAEAPWRCRGYRDGSIESVIYTGDEGAL
jgi:nucleoid-associated protein YgaU